MGESKDTETEAPLLENCAESSTGGGGSVALDITWIDLPLLNLTANSEDEFPLNVTVRLYIPGSEPWNERIDL